MAEKRKFNCELISKKKETERVVTLRSRVKGEKISFAPGQYVNVFLPDQFGAHGKSYTISNIPGEKFLEISVKKIGKFSTALHELKKDSLAVMEGPMGFFFPKEKNEDVVFLAAGIGITPFLSIFRNYVKNSPSGKKNFHLFYTNKTKDETAFFDELNEIADKNKDIKIHYYLTQETVKDKHIKDFGRIDIENVERKLECLAGKDYFICGPIRFVLDMRRALLDEGVDELNIYTEAFY